MIAAAFSSWPTVASGLVMFAAGGLFMIALKLIWGLLQGNRRTAHRIGGHMDEARAAVSEWSGGEGYVFADGELWRATSKDALAPGDVVQVKRVNGLTLEVRKK